MPRAKQTARKLRKKPQKGTPTGAEPHTEAALSPAQQLGSLGGTARAQSLTAEQRSEIAKKAAAKRWER